MMKYILVFLLSLYSTWTLGTSITPKPNSKDILKQVETDEYLSAVKEQQLEKQISESEEFVECKGKATPKEIEECIAEKVKNVDAEEFSKKVDLKSFDMESSKDAKSIRDYLAKRIRKALYGEDEDDATKKAKLAKIVDHAVYAKMYRSQIGKNILMEVSNYCLANLGVLDEPYQLVHHCVAQRHPEQADKTIQEVEWVAPTGCESLLGKASDSSNPSKFSSLNFIKDGDHKFAKDKFNKSSPLYPEKGIDLWPKLYEYEISETCKNKEYDSSGNKVSVSSDGYCYQNFTNNENKSISLRVRNTSFLDAVKEFEFELGPEYMKKKYQFCAFSAVHNMCEVYKCNYVYDQYTDPKKLFFCKNHLNITKDYSTIDNKNKTPDTSPGVVGLKACALTAKLKDYRQTLAALDLVDEDNKKNQVKTGFSRDQYGGGFYNYGNSGDEKSVEEITSISSAEFAENIKVGMNEEDAKELRDECLASGELSSEEKCQSLARDMDENSEKSVTAELETETQVYLKRLEELKDNETLKEYLIKNGYEKYADKIEEIGPDKLKKIIADEYKSERAALKKSMMDKFNKLTKKGDDAASELEFKNDTYQVAQDNLVDLEKQKERIQTLFQYNNIVSSYMSAKIGEGENAKETELSYQRDIELKGMSEFGDSDKANEYKDMFDNDQSGSSSGNETMSVDLNFIDSLLGNKDE